MFGTIDPGEIVEDHSESSMDPNGRSIDPSGNPREGSSDVRGGCSSQEQSPEGTGEKLLDHSHRYSGAEQQDAIQYVAHCLIEITSLRNLDRAMKDSMLSQVKGINLTVFAGHIINESALARALASGQMYALELLVLRGGALADERFSEIAKARTSLNFINYFEMIANALTRGKFPSLTRIEFNDTNIGPKGVEALGRAIQSGNLQKLTVLELDNAGINDDGMATLARAFQHIGDTKVLPNLTELHLASNPVTAVGLQALAEALKSGRLDSLRNLYLFGSSKPSEEAAKALMSAMEENNCLGIDMDFEWHLFPDLDRRQKQLRNRNIRNKDIVAGLLGCPMVAAAFGKIYLCGSPSVGKTTLTHTLRRTRWESLWTWERRPHTEKRTRGINVSQFSSKGTRKTKDQNPITLLVWDMAGQQDYHLVHNAFFPDLSFSEGKATTFVIVCNSKNLDEAKKRLQYWLQYIASSCHKTTTRLRHVFVVLNNMGGRKQVHGYAQTWKMLLEDLRRRFESFVNVHTNVFITDVRRRRKVSGLKTLLLEHSAKLLRDEKVPDMCQLIQGNLHIWSEGKEEFPVLDWKTYVQQLHKSIAPWPEQIIAAATKYLHEAGVVIHIDKNFPSQWGIPYRRLVVLDVNWFCKEIVGNLFLSEDMVDQTEHPFLFRKRVDEVTGSISISAFKEFFQSRWSDEEVETLITILLWLGLCYKGNEENLFIPSLIDKNGKPGDPWQSQSAYDDGGDQWVMGFSIEHKQSEMTLAPMSLWHRFQVQVAQTSRFTQEVMDNDFVAGKYFMTITIDYMYVLIKVDASEQMPTFHEISFFVKPKFKNEALDPHQRKQRQVDLADNLVELLLGLWDDICGGVEYVRKIVWPWPSFQFRPEYIVDRNVDVAKVKRLVQMHGMGRKMQWTVGDDSAITGAITEDQLLSTNDKKNVLKSVESDMGILREGMREAVNLRIYPPQLTEDSHPTDVTIKGVSSRESSKISFGIEEATTPMSPTHRVLMAKLEEVQHDVREVGDKVDQVFNKVTSVEIMLREGFTKVLNLPKSNFGLTN
ncbi:unnamed protein product [Calypogeia fissa]